MASLSIATRMARLSKAALVGFGRSQLRSISARLMSCCLIVSICNSIVGGASGRLRWLRAWGGSSCGGRVLVAGGDPGFPLRVVIVQACPRCSRQPAIWHQALSRITTAHFTNIGKLCPRCQRGRFFGPGVSGLQPLLPSLDAALCVLPQLSGSEPSDVGPPFVGHYPAACSTEELLTGGLVRAPAGLSI